MKITNLLASSRYFIVNKDLIKALGADGAIMLGELINERDYWQGKGQLEDDWFFSTIENVENEIGYSEYKQRKIIKALEAKKVIQVKIKGLPARRYIKINEEQLLILLGIITEKNAGNVQENNDKNNSNDKNLKNSVPSSLKTQELCPKKLRGNNNNIKIINNNTIITNNNKDNIYNYIEENFCRLLSPVEFERINLWLEDYSEDIVKYAVDIAVLKRKTTFAYTEGILKNWKGKGYTTLEQIKEENNEFIKKNEESYNKLLEQMKDLEDYDWLNDKEENS